MPGGANPTVQLDAAATWTSSTCTGGNVGWATMMVTMERVDTPSRTASVPSDFIAAYRRTLGEVYSYLASRVGDRSTAEDLTQEVFIAAARRFIHTRY